MEKKLAVGSCSTTTSVQKKDKHYSDLVPGKGYLVHEQRVCTRFSFRGGSGGGGGGHGGGQVTPLQPENDGKLQKN